MKKNYIWGIITVRKQLYRTFKLFYMGGSNMKKFRNILALLMVVVMLVAVMPMNVFAEDTGTPAPVTETPEQKLEKAKDAAKEDVDKLPNLTTQQKDEYKKKIGDASDEAGVKQAKEAAVTADKEALDKAKKDAKDAVEKLENLTPEQKTDAITAIENAQILQDVNEAKADAIAKDAENKKTKEEEEKKKAAEEEALKKEKKDAKDAVDKLDKLSNEDKEKFKKAIEDATDKKAVEEALNKAKAKANPSTPPAPAAEKYDINTKTVGNGTVTISAKKSEAGQTITVNATPNYGYVVDSIIVTKFRTDESVYKKYTHMSYFNDYPYHLGSRWYDDYDDYIRWCDRNGYSRYDSDNYRIWCRKSGYRYDYDDFRRFYDWDDVYGYRWYNRYDYSYYDQAEFTMPADHVTVTVTFTSAPYWYDGYYYDYETGTYRRYYGDDYYYYRTRRDRKAEEAKAKAEAAKKEEEEAKAKAEAEKQPQIYENKAVIAIGSNVLDKVSKNVHTVHQMDTPAYVKDGRVMLPLRYVAEALGLQVSWVPETKTVIIWDLTQRVVIPVKSNRIIVNGITYTSDVKPEIKSSRTMLPIANIARALGLIDGSDIIWDQYNKQVTLTRKVLSK